MSAASTGQPTGYGADALAAAMDSLGLTLRDATVLSPQADPFRLAVSANPADSAWLAERIDALGIALPIHNRGLHYVLIGQPKPDGSTYSNTADDWHWLETTSNTARWLGYIDFDDIIDQRNDAPTILVNSDTEPSADVWIPNKIAPTPLAIDFMGRQRYHLAMIGEKASLAGVLGPIAEDHDADLYLPTGNISNTMIHTLAKTSAKDGRPLRVFYFADCDPSGWNMSVEVGRKLQAFKVGFFPDLEFYCYRIGLTPDQVREHDLPISPVKETDKRAKAWEDATGVQQTEIDALATLQPDLLERIAQRALSPFYDYTLKARVDAAEARWRTAAQAVINDAIGSDTLGRIAAITDELESLRRRHFELPSFDIPKPKLDRDAGKPRPLISSRWDFAKQTQKLQAAKSYNNRPKHLTDRRNQALAILRELEQR